MAEYHRYVLDLINAFQQIPQPVSINKFEELYGF